MPRQGARELGLEDLPDELLGRCLDFLPLAEGRSVTLVCKRFRRLFFEQPGPWRHFSCVMLRCRALADCCGSAQLEVRHAVLRRVAHLVQEFSLPAHDYCPWWSRDGSDGKRPLADFLRLLPPSLTTLLLGAQPLPADICQLLRPLTALRSLVLHEISDASLAAALRHMTSLESLRCLRCCPAGLVGSMGQLSCLTNLTLRASDELPDLGGLTKLSQLRQLELVQNTERIENVCWLRPPPPAAFPRLEAYSIKCLGGSVLELGGMRCLSCKLASLMFGDEALLCLDLSTREHRSPLAVDIVDVESVEAFGLLPSLPALLAAAVPPGATLQALQLEGAHFSAAALRGCTQLAALRGLDLWECGCDTAAAAALFDGCPRLSHLCLGSPSRPQLSALFSGPRPRLRTLELGGRGGLPRKLPLLTGLIHLGCEGMAQLRLTAREVELLASLPQLRTLVLSKGTKERTSERVLLSLRRSLPDALIEIRQP